MSRLIYRNLNLRCLVRALSESIHHIVVRDRLPSNNESKVKSVSVARMYILTDASTPRALTVFGTEVARAGAGVIAGCQYSDTIVDWDHRVCNNREDQCGQDDGDKLHGVTKGVGDADKLPVGHTYKKSACTMITRASGLLTRGFFGSLCSSTMFSVVLSLYADSGYVYV